MKSLLEKPRPGQFKALCRLKVDRPFGQLTDEELTLVEFSNIKSRWDHKRNLEVVPIPCAFKTEYRDEFLVHMEQVHGVKPGHVRADQKRYPGKWVRGLTTAQIKQPKVGRWAGQPRLTEEGTDFDVSKTDGLMVRCECGLYAQLNGSQADELWWREHVTMCTERSAVA